MQHRVVTNTLHDLSETQRIGMFKLRYETFHTRLGWDVQTTDDGLEIDEFDSLQHAHYIVATSPVSREVDACWRLLPTKGRNMLRDVFPELLHGQPAPCGDEVWELSRFAIATGRLPTSEDAGNPQLGFGQLSVALMIEAYKFAQLHGIARYVTVTTTPIERMLRKLNLHVHRLGPPVRIGMVSTIACFIEVDDLTRHALGL